MLDLILHAVTNRANDFVSPVFSRVSTFHPVALDTDAQIVHDVLQLDFRQNDYYVVGLLQAIDAFPEIRQSFVEGQRASNISAWRRPPDTTAGGTLVANRIGPPNMRRLARTFPVSFQILLDYYQGDLRIQDGGTTKLLPPNPIDNTLFPDWPENLGITGGFATTGWGSGWTGAINHVPVSFPWNAAVEALNSTTSTTTLLRRASLVETYFLAQSSFEKVAVAALALGLANTGVYPP
jgi:hypothetical protein